MSSNPTLQSGAIKISPALFSFSLFALSRRSFVAFRLSMKNDFYRDVVVDFDILFSGIATTQSPLPVPNSSSICFYEDRSFVGISLLRFLRHLDHFRICDFIQRLCAVFSRCLSALATTVANVITVHCVTKGVPCLIRSTRFDY